MCLLLRLCCHWSATTCANCCGEMAQHCDFVRSEMRPLTPEERHLNDCFCCRYTCNSGVLAALCMMCHKFWCWGECPCCSWPSLASDTEDADEMDHFTGSEQQE